MLKQLFYLQSGSGENVKPQLALRIGEKHAGFAIMDLSSGIARELAWYVSEGNSGNYLPLLFEKHPILSLPFYKTVVSFDTADSTLVPLHLIGEPARQILKIISGIPDSSTIICEPLPEFELNNVYAVPGDLHFWIKAKLGPATYFHQYSVAARTNGTTGNSPAVFMEVRNEELVLLVKSARKLLLAQTFPYMNPEDALYYLLKSCQQFGFAQDSVEIRVSGLVDEQSAFFNELKPYFRNIGFREAGWKFAEGTANEFPGHFFTSLNDLNICVS